MDTKKQEIIRDAFYTSGRRCNRSKKTVQVYRNSDDSYSVVNGLDGAIYDVAEASTDGKTSYSFECIGYLPMRSSV